MNFSAFSIGTALLNKTAYTHILCLFGLRLERKLNWESNFILLLCTNAIILKMREDYLLWDLPRNVVDKKNSCWASIKCLNNWSKWLLASCVPNLHLDACLLIYLYFLGVELNSQGCSVPLTKLIFGESVEEAALSDPWRANYDHFKSFLLLFFHISCNKSNR